MIGRVLLVAGVTLALAGPLSAQDQPPPPPPPQADGPQAAPPPAPPPGHGPRQEAPRHGPRSGDRAGGPPPPPPPTPKGFELNYGRGVSLKVNCGDEAMAPCLEALRPVLEKMPVFNPAMMPPERP